MSFLPGLNSQGSPAQQSPRGQVRGQTACASGEKKLGIRREGESPACNLRSSRSAKEKPTAGEAMNVCGKIVRGAIVLCLAGLSGPRLTGQQSTTDGPSARKDGTAKEAGQKRRASKPSPEGNAYREDFGILPVESNS